MKDLLTEHRLARVQEQLLPRIAEITESFLKTPCTNIRMAMMRGMMEGALELALRAEYLEDVARFVFVDADPIGRVAVSVTVPAWDHDCRSCKFLGRVEVGAEIVDLYTCDGGGMHDWLGYRSFIARFGDEGPQYTSAPLSTLEQTSYFHPALYEAARRWRLS